ncbi:MAG: polysaccharide deacetylase family protein [Chloroflexota bacterium]
MNRFSGARPSATVSVDVDGVDLHLAGYGHQNLPPDSAVYGVALSRILDILARHSVRATFFVVGRDAEGQSTMLRQMVAAGHELAAHSMTHPPVFSRMPASQLAHEVTESRRVLAAATGSDVVGFRAPNWDLDRAAIPTLASAGYRYDASGFPSLFQIAARGLLAIKSRQLDPLVSMNLWPFTMRRLPHLLSAGESALGEFPISVTPVIRWPIYHTVRYMIDSRRFETQLDGFVRRREPFFYPLHAIDGLGLREDRADPRLAGHPGMDRSLEEKLDILNRAVEAIAARFDCAPYRDLTRLV